MPSRVLIGILFLVVVTPVFSAELTLQHSEDRLRALHESAEQVNGELFRVREELRRSQLRLSVLQQRSTKLQQEEERLQRQLDDVFRELLDVEEEAQAILDQHDRLQQRREARIVAMDSLGVFSSPKGQLFQFVSLSLGGSAPSPGEEADLSILMERVQRADNELQQQAAKLLEQLHGRQEQERELLARQQQLYNEIREERAALADIFVEREQEMQALREKQREGRLAVMKFQAEALRLETALSSWESRQIPEPRVSGRAKRRVLVQPSEPAHSLPSLAAGSLSPPMFGEIERAFQEGEAGDPLRKGIVFRARADHQSERSAVSPVADGLVRFVGRLPFFGNSVILEHQPGELSLYGNMERVLVEEGTFAPDDRALGQVAAGETLYLELRIGGKAINPAPLLRQDAS
ncbi:peptidoglycan DD-metalloendopeptidase family protein [bacterium]|nr:peptidoglycan DD-metalloendopeptidase family protein [bacterium]